MAISSKDLLSKMRELRMLDNELGEYGRKLVFDIITNGIGNLAKTQERGLANIGFSGSLREGGLSARIFKRNDRFLDNLNREVEVDLEFVLLEIPIEHKSCIMDLKEKKGYVNISIDRELLKNCRYLGWKVSDEDLETHLEVITTNDGFLQPYKLKEAALAKLTYNGTNKVVELLIAAALNKKPKDISIEDIKQDVTKSSIGSDFLLKVHKQPFVAVSFDTVLLFRLPWWPSIADQWKERQRNWPSQTAIDNISSVSYIIAKPSRDGKNERETTELRYAFSHVERNLVDMRKPHQSFVYLVFKVMFYKWIKPIDSDRMTSFIAKTIMFWTCEEFPPDHEFWNDDEQSVIEALSYLFKQMLEAFKSENLPYFFLADVNVIESFSELAESKKEELQTKVSSILSNITSFIPYQIENEMKAGNEILNTIKALYKVFEEIKRNDYSRLLRQPELIPDVFEFFMKEVDFDKIKREAKRIQDQIKNEAKRTESRILNETARVESKIRSEAPRIESQIRNEAPRIESQVRNEAARVESQVRHEAGRVVKKLFRKK